MADLLAKCSYQESSKAPKEDWELHTDGSSTTSGSGVGVFQVTLAGKTVDYAIKFQFKSTNNEVEYEAAIAGLNLYKSLEAKRVILKTDSQLVVNQVNGEYETSYPSMIQYLAKIKELISGFEGFTIERLPRT